ncbi:MAG: hypothetical protein QXZ70_00825 [Candidatus Bathyarchaeia archaeon]
MQCNYPSQKVKFDHALDAVKLFFESKGFLVSIVNKGSTCNVLVYKSVEKKLIVRVELSQDSGNFVINYVVLVSQGKMGFLGPILNIFGGGIFALRDLKIGESMRKLEEEFWREMDDLFYRRF